MRNPTGFKTPCFFFDAQRDYAELNIQNPFRILVGTEHCSVPTLKSLRS